MNESNYKSNYKRAIFAGGCFWCTEAAFDLVDGVIKTTSGYTGGTIENPTYEQVSSGKSGHTEALEVTYDPAQVDYPFLLDVFWRSIDPTDRLGQFYDRGSQYRTAIFYIDEEQKQQAEASKISAQKRIGEDKKIVTTIEPASEFYVAEEYHQDYHKKSPQRYNAYKDGSGREEKLKRIWKE